jgi:hypothetical protein
MATARSQSILYDATPVDAITGGAILTHAEIALPTVAKKCCSASSWRFFSLVLPWNELAGDHVAMLTSRLMTKATIIAAFTLAVLASELGAGRARSTMLPASASRSATTDSQGTVMNYDARGRVIRRERRPGSDDATMQVNAMSADLPRTAE